MDKKEKKEDLSGSNSSSAEEEEEKKKKKKKLRIIPAVERVPPTATVDRSNDEHKHSYSAQSFNQTQTGEQSSRNEEVEQEQERVVVRYFLRSLSEQEEQQHTHDQLQQEQRATDNGGAVEDEEIGRCGRRSKRTGDNENANSNNTPENLVIRVYLEDISDDENESEDDNLEEFSGVRDLEERDEESNNSLPNNNLPEVPEAYPVSFSTVYEIAPSPIIRPQQHSTVLPTPPQVEEEDSSSNFLFKNNKWKVFRCAGIIFSLFIVGYLAVMYLLMALDTSPSQKEEDKPKHTTNNPLSSDNATQQIEDKTNNNTSSDDDHYVIYDNTSQPTLVDSSNSTTTSEQEQINNTSFKCFLDPWEIYMYEEVLYREGADPSIPRTYQICPNSHLRIKYYDHQLERFDEHTGDYDSFILFRPNVHIKCGEDGSYSNNCTLSGGLHHVFLISVSVFEMHKILDTSTENVTFEGFRFTEARGGTNIMNWSFKMDLTLKNCRFDHNYDMFTSIMSAHPYSISSTLSLQNCTFEHNTYKFYHVYLNRPNIGVIASYTTNNTDFAIVNNYISNTVFRNNTFLLEDDPETIMLLLHNDFTPEDVYVNGAILNLMPSWGVLEITDSCFVQNKGYTNSLIIMDKDDRIVVQNSHGNYFAENEPRDADELSCILLKQNISYVDGHPMGVQEKEESCGDESVIGFVNVEDETTKASMVCLM